MWDLPGRYVLVADLGEQNIDYYQIHWEQPNWLLQNFSICIVYYNLYLLEEGLENTGSDVEAEM